MNLKGLAVAALCLMHAPLYAHHILGIPHYTYDENYPQMPYVKLVERVGRWEFQITGFPGHPKPGERTQWNVYAHDIVTHQPYSGDIRMHAETVKVFAVNHRFYGPEAAHRDG
ncbi:MAG: hypothetical protein AABZ44_06925, partial [Elusimicrobiota bacterium]